MGPRSSVVLRGRLGFAPALAIAALGCTSEGAPRPAPERDVLVEFDGVAPNGTWDAHELAGGFEYEVTPAALVMHDRAGANQHVVRRGVALDPARPYLIEALFAIAAPDDGVSPNSFCFNLNVAGSDGDLSPPSTWALNVDLGPGATGGVMKHMGFVAGAFQQIGEQPISWGERGREYRFRVDVNVDASGLVRPRVVTASVFDGDVLLERFDVDYSTFSYQPGGEPVRVGMNTHGTDWTLRELRVAYLD